PPVDVEEQPAIDGHQFGACAAPAGAGTAWARSGAGEGSTGGVSGGGVMPGPMGRPPNPRERVCPATGAAEVPPAVPCSTMTTMATFGFSAGAKQTNQAWGWYSRARLLVSRRACVTTCAEPVLPATCTPSSRARAPVPPLTTAIMASR